MITPQIVQQFNFAKSAGLTLHIVYFARRKNSAAVEVENLMATIPTVLFQTVWIAVGGSDWSSFSSDSNCAYLIELINIFKQKGKNPGIYAGMEWPSSFGDRYACAKAASQPLMYYSNYHSLTSPFETKCNNFDDFLPFGGWTKPYMVVCQGNGIIVCEMEVAEIYYE
jgi:hypothetical protein